VKHLLGWQEGRLEGVLILLGLLGIVLATDCPKELQPGDPLPRLTKEQLDEFERGRVVFERVFAEETGLGPLFNAESCAECHEDPVTGGAGDEIELHASLFHEAGMATVAGVTPGGVDGFCDALVDSGGPIYQLRATSLLQEALGITAEPVPAGAQKAQRTSPDIFGFGLLDAVPDSVLLYHADPDDANGDGISGRPNRFFDGRIGRFGRKAVVPTLAEFNAGAFQIEQGVTTPQAPEEGTVGGRPLPPGVDPVPDPELDAESVRLAQQFVRFLAPPPRAKAKRGSTRGEQIFAQLRCTACHVPVLRTGANEVKALEYREVRAYSDLLLHDMGPELADICLGEAEPAEFRTEPLMGLRFSQHFLHDGRAATLEEAIRLHGGEAAAARDAFLALTPKERAALLAFLAGL